MFKISGFTITFHTRISLWFVYAHSQIILPRYVIEVSLHDFILKIAQPWNCSRVWRPLVCCDLFVWFVAERNLQQSSLHQPLNFWDYHFCYQGSNLLDQFGSFWSRGEWRLSLVFNWVLICPPPRIEWADNKGEIKETFFLQEGNSNFKRKNSILNQKSHQERSLANKGP